MPDAPSITLRPATLGDTRRVWEWRNEESTRRASFNTDSIPYEMHEAWFPRQLAKPDCRMFVVEADGHPCGVIRIDRLDAEPEISIALAPECRGRGYGTRALQDASARVFRDSGAARITALVRDDNPASARAFVRAGFAAVGSLQVSGIPARRYAIERSAFL